MRPNLSSRINFNPIWFLLFWTICSHNFAFGQLTSTTTPGVTTTTPGGTTTPGVTTTTPRASTPGETTTPFPRPWDSCYSDNSTCPPNFYCSDDRCECRDAIYKRKDYDLRSCQTIVSGSCEYDEECVKNSFCNTITKTCTCSPGSLPTPLGECRFDVGVTCDLESIERECNIYEGLYCIEGRCACADSSLVYELGAGCRAQAGALCGKILLSWEGFSPTYGGTDRVIVERPVKCGGGLICQLDEGDFTQKGICVENTP